MSFADQRSPNLATDIDPAALAELAEAFAVPPALLVERRQRARLCTSVAVEVAAAGDPHPRRRPLRNVGRDGLSFSTTRPMRPGTTLSLRFRTGSSPIVLAGRVAWSQLADQGWEVGVHYVGGDDALRARLVSEVAALEAD